jgi:hypothetical protein
VRYQAALRPDMKSWIDSKVLSNFISTPALDFWFDRAQTVHLFAYCTITVRIRSSVVGAILKGLRLSGVHQFAPACFPSFGIYERDLLKARMVVCPYNPHTRLLC